MKATTARKKIVRREVRADPTKSAAMIRLLREWIADESGYDEATWPVVKQAIEENALSDRKRFGE